MLNLSNFVNNDTKVILNDSLINTNLILLMRAHGNVLKLLFFFCGLVKLGQMLKSESQ